ncbi:DegQ family serine endoprotease [Solemya velesiana gill symbiont]|uniref:Probable periplasmic serine endoprotease DegP-like n=1 Tax=Solemya velesiana gill symbiont TaxID=1918948 RepID=A0A1T2KX49_9GAMM|nr:DegQ family serine endoprotease [Solemya velesiana gill symbiont]OOZ37371.1 serine peptidase [Solemya velesiana gill symbiont]
MRALISKSQYLVFGLALFLIAAAELQARSLPDFTKLVESYSPAVVNISTKQNKTVKNKLKREFHMPDPPEGSPFNEFFKHFFGEGYGGDFERHFDTQSLGSGFIISEDGYLLTNNHVVEEADEVLVRLSDHREFTAKVIGKDKRSDVALLKIEADDLPTVKIVKGSDLKVGEWVLAIGSPFGFDHSVTAGIVSAKGRSLPNENYVPFIQTDVAINPGNSGGPLFNLDGEVVGVNSQIYSRTGGFMGLSFAIPIEMAMNVADQLREKGRVSRGWLGVLIQDVTRELADSFGMEHPHGAIVAKVLPDSPAEEAGLEQGDVILTFNGQKLYNSSMLPPLVGSSRIDKPATVEIVRAGKRKTIKINIGELPEDDKIAQISQEGFGQQSDVNVLGLVAADITPEMRKEQRLENVRGVIVEEVRPGPAKAAGLTEGDVIQMINNTRVDNLEQFNAQVEALQKGKTTAVLVLRPTGPRFLALHVPEE